MTDLKQPLTPEILVPRLGDYLIEQKLITPDQLTYALQQQSAMRKTQPEAPLLGELMIELGIITHSGPNASRRTFECRPSAPTPRSKSRSAPRSNATRTPASCSSMRAM